jgi:outer membrane receptor protein involved in Fe transport
MFPGQITLDLSAQVAEGKALDNDSYLDDVSPTNFAATVRKQFGERAFAQIRGAYFSDDDHFGPTERAVPGYTLVDAGVGFRVARPLELRLLGRNLLNEELFASQDVRTILAPGRSVSLTANVRF